ncbi:CpaF family protein [Thiorhodococcus minor]|uniref:CpaF family protein n=1 Tax=Thiorhodococcus minor TaxID=57489 RepID=A0A6M0K273_9GAMM|nr:ATPase, T2SS/T4P/T4SS family [Thiorhodococcus minor]NEV63033.1 CpaF family protein [Thiorhodococcus minor]
MNSGRAKLDQLLSRPDITEIMINGQRTFIEVQGKKQQSDLVFSEQDLAEIVEALFTKSGKAVSPRFPFADITLPDGARINVIIPPLSRYGTAITIRKFSQDLQGLDDLIAAGSMSRKMADFLVACLKGRLNILFSGGTGTGKTTTMEMLSRYIDERERIITIEDTAELKLHHDDWVALETRRGDEDGRGEVTLQDLIKNALRMRPDRIIIGEIRGEEALDYLQTMATGHRGTLAVVHGSSPREIMARLETMILTSGIDLPHVQIRQMLGTFIDIIVQQERFPDGVRRITHITEVAGVRQQDVELRDLFLYQGSEVRDSPTGSFKTAISSFPRFYSDFVRCGLLSENFFAN